MCPRPSVHAQVSTPKCPRPCVHAHVSTPMCPRPCVHAQVSTPMCPHPCVHILGVHVPASTSRNLAPAGLYPRRLSTHPILACTRSLRTPHPCIYLAYTLSLRRAASLYAPSSTQRCPARIVSVPCHRCTQAWSHPWSHPRPVWDHASVPHASTSPIHAPRHGPALDQSPVYAPRHGPALDQSPVHAPRHGPTLDSSPVHAPRHGPTT
jgi:hypothetical protein